MIKERSNSVGPEKWGDREGRRQVAQMISRGVCVSGEPHKTCRLHSVISQKIRGDQIFTLLSLEIFYFISVEIVRQQNETSVNLNTFVWIRLFLTDFVILSGMLSVSVLQFCLISSSSQYHI
jgi:hypothetical protein